jgi:hypothetical protein
MKDAPEVACSEAEAREDLDRARANAARLEAQEGQARAIVARTASTRAKIGELREQARLDLAGSAAPTAEEIAAAATAYASAVFAARDLERRLALARENLERVGALREDVGRRTVCGRSAQERYDALLTQAEELESALADAAVAPPSETEIVEAATAVGEALSRLEGAQAYRRADAAWRAAAEADEAAKAAEAKADRLDQIVRALADDAPRELVMQSAGVPGLTISGDAILIDGVDIAAGCSGAEQMAFAVELARRANATSKILVVDNLERLDGAEFARFVELATKDGYQVFGARVQDCDLIVEPIEQSANLGKGASDAAQR